MSGAIAELGNQIWTLAYEGAWHYQYNAEDKARALVAGLSEDDLGLLRVSWVRGRNTAYKHMDEEAESLRQAERKNEEALSGAYWGPDWTDPQDVREFYHYGF